MFNYAVCIIGYVLTSALQSLRSPAKLPTVNTASGKKHSEKSAISSPWVAEGSQTTGLPPSQHRSLTHINKLAAH